MKRLSLFGAAALAVSCSAQNLTDVLKQGEQVFAKSCATGYCHEIGAGRVALHGWWAGASIRRISITWSRAASRIRAWRHSPQGCHVRTWWRWLLM
jgi:hypothetical protein